VVSEEDDEEIDSILGVFVRKRVMRCLVLQARTGLTLERKRKKGPNLLDWSA
jgi:hypothetical protein